MDDLISRQAAIKTAHFPVMDDASYEVVRVDDILALPSAQPDVTDTNVGDMISRQAAISEIMEDIKDRSLHDDPATPEDYAEGYDEGIRNAAAIVLQMPSAQPGWISCSERLPYAEYGESDTVWTTCGYRDVEDTSVRWIRLLYFNGGNWCYPTGETYEAKVYAWMPLPTPYREGGQDG